MRDCERDRAQRRRRAFDSQLARQASRKDFTLRSAKNALFLPSIEVLIHQSRTNEVGKVLRFPILPRVKTIHMSKAKSLYLATFHRSVRNNEGAKVSKFTYIYETFTYQKK